MLMLRTSQDSQLGILIITRPNLKSVADAQEWRRNECFAVDYRDYSGNQMSIVQNLCCLMIIVAYTTQYNVMGEEF